MIARLFASEVVSNNLYPDALYEINTLKKNGHKIVLASASLNIYVEEIGKILGFTNIISTKVEIDKNKKITGRLDGPNLRGIEKLNAVKKIIGKNDYKNITFYTDSISDTPMLNWVEFPVIINPTPKAKNKFKNQKNISFRYWL